MEPLVFILIGGILYIIFLGVVVYIAQRMN
jgi:type II secretory pathway component PulF